LRIDKLPQKNQTERQPNFGPFLVPIIPPNIMADDRLTANEKLLYGLLFRAHLDEKTRAGFWTGRMLSDALKLPVDRTQTLVDSLTEKGLVKRHPHGDGLGDFPAGIFVVKDGDALASRYATVLFFMNDKTEGLGMSKKFLSTKNIKQTPTANKTTDALPLPSSASQTQFVNTQISENAQPEADQTPKPFTLQAPGKSFGQRVRDAVPPQKSKTPKPIEQLPLLDRIMALPNLPQHKPHTKLYQAAAEQLELVAKGKFFLVGGKPRLELDPKWCEQFSVGHAILVTAWPEFQVMHIFGEISKLYTPGWEPLDKSGLPRSIPDILYNPRSRKSLFAKMAVPKNAAVPAAERPTATRSKGMGPIEAIVFRMLRQAAERCGLATMSPDELSHLERATDKMVKEYPEIRKKSDGTIDAPSTLASDYAQWVVDEHAGRLETPKQLGPGTRDWLRYLRSRGFSK